jgi:hypothetical protein
VARTKRSLAAPAWRETPVARDTAEMPPAPLALGGGQQATRSLVQHRLQNSETITDASRIIHLLQDPKRSRLVMLFHNSSLIVFFINSLTYSKELVELRSTLQGSSPYPHATCKDSRPYLPELKKLLACYSKLIALYEAGGVPVTDPTWQRGSVTGRMRSRVPTILRQTTVPARSTRGPH